MLYRVGLRAAIAELREPQRRALAPHDGVLLERSCPPLSSLIQKFNF